MAENRLWGATPTPENLATAADYQRSFANRDHILIIAAEAPKGFREMTDEYLPLLQEDDLQWLDDMSRDIFREEAEKNGEAFAEWTKRFLERFERELEAARHGAGNN